MHRVSWYGTRINAAFHSSVVSPVKTGPRKACKNGQSVANDGVVVAFKKDATKKVITKRNDHSVLHQIS